MNIVCLLGRLGFDPDPVQSGCKLMLAVESWNGKEKITTWVRVLVFGSPGSLCLKHKKKGDLVSIQGRLEKRTGTEELVVIAKDITFI